ncbi:hypothetical protein FIBSPDRAFT_881420 [Athelia psychrophila]|uniref:Uncharacterized protein n=1 Tax=Athelia psychrophila TaxID=1759441 RepID=A0A166WND5_9AGAM|nr:hypothetical protein FIBSPDRAFT_881420 [Fibularhizoctonia sp. CBS 109695]
MANSIHCRPRGNTAGRDVMLVVLPITIDYNDPHLLFPLPPHVKDSDILRPIWGTSMNDRSFIQYVGLSFTNYFRKRGEVTHANLPTQKQHTKAHMILDPEPTPSSLALPKLIFPVPGCEERSFNIPRNPVNRGGQHNRKQCHRPHPHSQHSREQCHVEIDLALSLHSDGAVIAPSSHFPPQSFYLRDWYNEWKNLMAELNNPTELYIIQEALKRELKTYSWLPDVEPNHIWATAHSVLAPWILIRSTLNTPQWGPSPADLTDTIGNDSPSSSDELTNTPTIINSQGAVPRTSSYTTAVQSPRKKKKGLPKLSKGGAIHRLSLSPFCTAVSLFPPYHTAEKEEEEEEEEEAQNPHHTTNVPVHITALASSVGLSCPHPFDARRWERWQGSMPTPEQHKTSQPPECVSQVNPGSVGWVDIMALDDCEVDKVPEQRPNKFWLLDDNETLTDSGPGLLNQ